MQLRPGPWGVLGAVETEPAQQAQTTTAYSSGGHPLLSPDTCSLHPRTPAPSPRDPPEATEGSKALGVSPQRPQPAGGKVGDLEVKAVLLGKKVLGSNPGSTSSHRVILDN